MDILPQGRLIQELDALLPDLKRWHEAANGAPHLGTHDDDVAARVPAVMARLTSVFAEMRARGYTLPTCPPLWLDQRAWVNVVVPYLMVHRDVVAANDKPSLLGRVRRWAGSLWKRAAKADAPNPLVLSQHRYRSGMTEAELVYWCGPPERFRDCVTKLANWFDTLIAQVEHGAPYSIDVNEETPVVRDVLDVVVVPRLALHGFVAPVVPEWETDPLAWYHGWQDYFAKVTPYVQSDAAAGVA